MKAVPTTSAKTKILIGAIAFAAALLLLFFLRYPIIRVYASIFYKPAVGKHFDQGFQPVNTQLQELGFTFTDMPPQRYVYHGCTTAYTGGSTSCTKSRSSDKRSFTQELVDTWKQKSPALQTFLIENGWKRIGDTSFPIENLYKDPDNQLGVAIFYEKAYGRTLCEISIIYNASVEDTHKTYVNESCRQIRTFPDLHRADH